MHELVRDTWLAVGKYLNFSEPQKPLSTRPAGRGGGDSLPEKAHFTGYSPIVFERLIRPRFMQLHGAILLHGFWCVRGGVKPVIIRYC